MSDNFNFDGKPSRPQGTPLQIWDMLSILVLIMTVCLGAYFVLVFINPESSLNLLPPGGRGSEIPTATTTPLQLEPTWTASPTLALTPSDTPRPTFTPFFTNTPFSLVPPTKTPKPTSTPKAAFGVVSPPRNVDATLYNPDHGCNWQGVAGAVLDENNADYVQSYFVVVVVGKVNGIPVGPGGQSQIVPRTSPQYGLSGWELKFPWNEPVLSKGELYVQLLDIAGVPMSDKIPINISDKCSENLTLVRFKANR